VKVDKIKKMDIQKSVIARYKKGSDNFEILVDCDKALEYRKGKKIDLMDVVIVETVFSDSKKALKVPQHKLLGAFDTEDFYQIADIIIKQGEVQVNKQHMDKEREGKLNRIIALIHRNAIDSKTGLPHPPQRIKNAMEEVRVKIEEHKTAEQQIDRIIDELRAVIPLKIEVKQIELKVPAKYVGNALKAAKGYGKVNKEQWMDDGSFYVSLELPAGLMEDFISEINNSCHGDVEIKIAKEKK